MIRFLQKQHRFRPFFLFFLTLILIISCSFPGINAQEESKPKVEDWQFNGILAALDDPYPEVKVFAFSKVSEYDGQSIPSETLENIAKQAANILKDENVDKFVRRDAAEALGNLGDAAKPYVKDLVYILKDKNVNEFVRRGAAIALGNLGDAAKPHIPDLVDILKDKNVNEFVRGDAAKALGNLGDAAKPHIPDLVDILKDKNVNEFVRGDAAKALGNLGDAAKPHIPDLVDILKDKNVNEFVRGDAAKALGNLGDAAKPYAKDLVDILNDENVDSLVRYNAAEALGNLGDVAKPHIPDLVDILKDKNVDSLVRRGAAIALGNLGDAAKPHIPDLVDILKDKNVDSLVRRGAAEALGNLGDAAKPHIPDIVDILKDENVNEFFRGDAAEALGNLGDAAKPHIPDIVDILKDENVDTYIRGEAGEALEKITGKLQLENLVAVLEYIYYKYHFSNNEFAQWRFRTYFLSGGTEEVKTLLTWLGKKDSKGIPEILKPEEGREILQLFAETWKYSAGLEELRADLVEKIAYVVKITPWQPQDISLLDTHYKILDQAGSNYADAILSVRDNLKYWKWFFEAINLILTHIAFWLALIFAYPKFPQIQAIFFWNPSVRKILGIGYVDFLLTWIPFLRRKLFEPFKPSLLADANLDNFHGLAYFPNSNATKKRHLSPLEKIPPITQAIPAIKGEIVLQGNSGLGKSTFLRHLLCTSRRIVVYLPARKCDQGVIAAIQAKLHGQAKDEAFLKNLIYSGAIDICIDGLNEVTADTRAQIRQFVESYFRGNIIMTTQPLEWEPPATATTYYLQPLAKEQIKEFLLSRQAYLSPDAVIQGDDYRDACINYLNKILDESQSEEELTAAQNILSNPMDLTVVSQMLSQNKQPELFSLVEQQYNLMAEEYQDNWQKPFPLKTFSEAVYKMRLKDESILPTEQFYNELIAMEDEKYKMVISRQWQDNKGKSKQQWCFRHDKIMDFFLVQTFLGDSEPVQAKLIDHMGDPRFRGVYFLLANLLSAEDALSLREELIQYAADTRDHTVSDTFVTLLRTRPQLSQRN